MRASRSLVVPDKTISPIRSNSVSAEDIRFYADDDISLTMDWTPNPKKKLTPFDNAVEHSGKHLDEFPEIGSHNDYVSATKNFLLDPPAGTQSVMRNNNDILRYHSETGKFGVLRSDGTPRTMFRPDNSDVYWQKQLESTLNGGDEKL